MNLLTKTKDEQSTRYHFVGAFRLIEEDWQKKARKRLNNNSSTQIIIQEIFNEKNGKQNA